MMSDSSIDCEKKLSLLFNENIRKDIYKISFGGGTGAGVLGKNTVLGLKKYGLVISLFSYLPESTIC